MTFTLQCDIPARPEEVYQAWLTSEGHSAMTGGEASCSDQVGEKFSAWDGYIVGQNIVLDPPNKIIQSWRTSEFSDKEEDSLIEVSLNGNGDTTRLKLMHSKLPAHGEQYRKGWEEHYFEPMIAYFSKKDT